MDNNKKLQNISIGALVIYGLLTIIIIIIDLVENGKIQFSNMIIYLSGYALLLYAFSTAKEKK